MKVLLACETSQVVTREFRLLGHEAFSCDLQSSTEKQWHLQQDVTPLLDLDWDLIIAFPPCTHLAISGAAHFADKVKDGRQQKGIDFFMQFVNAKCQRIAIENPIGIMSSLYQKPDQIIQPYQFGDEARKSTCLWLKNLPKLVPTKYVNQGEDFIYPDGKRMPKWIVESRHSVKTRSRTFVGIAKAMATQWGNLPKELSLTEMLRYL